MKLGLLLCALFERVISYNIVALGVSDLVANHIESSIQSLSFHNSLTIASNLEEIKSSGLQVDLLFVNSTNKVVQQAIASHSNIAQIPTVVFDSGVNSEFVFFTEQSEECLTQSIVALINHLKLKTIAVVWLNTERNFKILLELNEISAVLVQHTSFLESHTESEVTKTLNKVFKIEGVQNYVFLANDYYCEVFNSAFTNSRLNKEGNVGIFTEKCIYQVNLNNSIVLSESLTANSDTKEAYYETLINNYISVLSGSELQPIQVAKRLQNSIVNCKYSVINIEDSALVTKGNIYDNNLTIELPLYTYGGLTDRSNYTRPKLTISANTGILNPPGYSPVYSNQKYQQGTYFAVDKINRDRSYFEHFDFELYDKVDCGASVFDYNFSKECILRHRKHMGLAYVPSFYRVTNGLLRQMIALDIEIPTVGGVGSSVDLSNKTFYPYFIKMTTPSPQFASAWTNLISIYGWDKIVTVVSNDTFGLGAYQVIYNSQGLYHYEIINDEKTRIVPNVYDNSTIGLYKGIMQEIIDLGCNIIFFLMPDPTPYFWLEGFYDLGVRRGDFTFIFTAITQLDSLSSPLGNYVKRNELLHGSFTIFNGAWVGEYGQKMKEEMLKSYPVVWSRSYYIDAVYTIAEGISFLMKQGNDYEDVDILMQALRGVRFVGATGTISFDVDTNDRNMYFFNVFNFYQDDNGVWHDDAIALISPLGSVYYSILQQPVWSNGVQPTSMKELYKNCPFREDQIRDSSTGRDIKIGVSIVVLFISSALTIYALKKIKREKLNMLQEKVLISFPDYMTLAFILIENLQLIAIGPSFASFNRFLNNVSEVASLNLSKATNFKDTTFWIVFYSMLTASYFWIAILIISLFKLCRCFKSLTANIESIKEYSIPIFSNILFLPIIVSLISILMCDKSSGSNITDSYLNYDCNVSCWKGKHVALAIIACIQITVYIPVAILYRTLWQDHNKQVNVRTNSVYLILKNISVVILVIIGKILKEDYELVHSLLFLGIEISVFIIILIIRRPFNYDRANLWSKVMVVCVIWNTFVCIIGNYLISVSIASLLLQLLGWVGIIISGFVIQSKLGPNYLISLKGRSIVELFKFAFGKRNFLFSAYDDNQEEVEISNLCQPSDKVNISE